MATNPYLKYLKSVAAPNIREQVNVAAKMLGLKKYVETNIVQAPMRNRWGDEIHGTSGTAKQRMPSGRMVDVPGQGKAWHRIDISTDNTPWTVPEEVLHSLDKETGDYRAAKKLVDKKLPGIIQAAKRAGVPKEHMAEYIGKQTSDIMWPLGHKDMKVRRQQLLKENPQWIGKEGIVPYAATAYKNPDIPEVRAALRARTAGVHPGLETPGWSDEGRKLFGGSGEDMRPVNLPGSYRVPEVMPKAMPKWFNPKVLGKVGKVGLGSLAFIALANQLAEANENVDRVAAVGPGASNTDYLSAYFNIPKDRAEEGLTMGGVMKDWKRSWGME